VPWRDLRTLLAAFGLAAHLLVACAAGAPVDGGRPAAPFDSDRPAAPSNSGRPATPSDSGRLVAPSDSGRLADSGRPAAPADGGTVRLRLLALNDFHGALSSRTVRGRPAGGAAVLATYLTRRAAEAEAEGATALLVHAGDMIGGSPLNSALLQDEPTVRALDAMGMAFGAAGNHEFDEGLDELLRLQQGGCHPKTEPATGCFEGARFRWLAANVVRAGSDRLVLPPYVVVEAGGIPVGFIGVVLAGTPAIQTPRGVAGLKFLDEAETVNRYVAELAGQGVRAIVVLIHQGGSGSLDGTAPIEGPIVDVVRRFHPQVDLVVSGHTHRGYVGWLRGRLITQAYANGTAFADIDLVLDRRSRDVVASRAEVVTAFHQPDPGNPASAVPPDRAVAAIVARANALVAKVAGRVVGTAAAPISRARSPAGESALGNLIADAQRAKTGTQVAFTNPGGIRDDVRAGTVTYGDLFAVQPFGNALVTMTLGGDQLARLLEQQWRPGPDGSVFVRVLQLSGLRYTWNARRPPGRKVVDLRLSDGRPIDPAASYTVAVNSFLADGGDGFQVLREATSRRVGAGDLEALVEFITRLPQPFTAAVEGRIHRE
jgi:5'-nucleotidase